MCPPAVTHGLASHLSTCRRAFDGAPADPERVWQALHVASVPQTEYRKYKATFPVAPLPAPPRPPHVFLRATGSPPPAALAAGQRWRPQAKRRPDGSLRTGSRRGWGGGGQDSGRAAGRDRGTRCRKTGRTTGANDDSGTVGPRAAGAPACGVPDASMARGSVHGQPRDALGVRGMPADSHASPPTGREREHHRRRIRQRLCGTHAPATREGAATPQQPYILRPWYIP